MALRLKQHHFGCLAVLCKLQGLNSFECGSKAMCFVQTGAEKGVGNIWTAKTLGGAKDTDSSPLDSHAVEIEVLDDMGKQWCCSKGLIPCVGHPETYEIDTPWMHGPLDRHSCGREKLPAWPQTVTTCSPKLLARIVPTQRLP